MVPFLIWWSTASLEGLVEQMCLLISAETVALARYGDDRTCSLPAYKFLNERQLDHNHSQIFGPKCQNGIGFRVCRWLFDSFGSRF